MIRVFDIFKQKWGTAVPFDTVGNHLLVVELNGELHSKYYYTEDGKESDSDSTPRLSLTEFNHSTGKGVFTPINTYSKYVDYDREIDLYSNVYFKSKVDLIPGLFKDKVQSAFNIANAFTMNVVDFIDFARNTTIGITIFEECKPEHEYLPINTRVYDILRQEEGFIDRISIMSEKIGYSIEFDGFYSYCRPDGSEGKDQLPRYSLTPYNPIDQTGVFTPFKDFFKHDQTGK
jgi:hypothetical protein